MHQVTATIFILSFTLVACSSLSDSSTNTLIRESSNLRQNKKAILFLKEGGATVADSYQVTISDIDHKLGKGEVGNTFTVDTNHGETSLDSSSIIFIWLTNDSLQIEFDKRLRTFTQEKKVDGIEVIYTAR